MSKKINYNYAFLFYDVNEKMLAKKECRKYLRYVKNIYHIFKTKYLEEK